MHEMQRVAARCESSSEKTVTMNGLLRDSYFAMRMLARQTWYSIVTISVLAIAVGANTTIFAVLNGLFLRPLPYPDDNRLVYVGNSLPKLGVELMDSSVPDYLDRRERAESLEDLAIFVVSQHTLVSGESPDYVLLSRVSPSLFDVLGVAPVLGRGFAAEEAIPGNERVIVLSDGLWRTRFGGNPDVISSDVLLDDEKFRVIGVMPKGFGFPNRNVDALVPFAPSAQQTSDDARENFNVGTIGRLRPGATIDELNAELDAIVRTNLEQGRLPQGQTMVDETGFTGRAWPLRNLLVGNLEQRLLLLQGSVLALLLIACANIANLQLARTVGRRKEFAVRSALGANKRRLARLVWIESMTLASCGGILGLVLAYGGLDLVRGLGLDRGSEGFQLAMDPTVVVFTVAATVSAGLICGLFPLALVRENLARAMQDGGRGARGGLHANRFRSGLAVLQVAVSFSLLAGGGILTKNFYESLREGVGFDTEGLWTGQITLPDSRYPGEDAQAAFYGRLLDDLRALPGVSAAGFTSLLPFSGRNTVGAIVVEDYTPPPNTPPAVVQQRTISDGYLSSLEIPVVEGRDFAEDERERVAIVNENVADRYWPAGNALGRRIRHAADPEDRWYTVVGVVPGIKEASISDERDSETVYWHYKQRPAAGGALTVTSALPVIQLTRVVRDAVSRIDPELPLYDVMPMSVRVLRSADSQRAPMVLTVLFAAVGFALAVVGIYGVLTWAVTQRFEEFGVRITLGARRIDVLRIVLGQGARLVLIGLVLGIGASIALGQVISSQILDADMLDPVVLGIVAVGLGGAALVASWLPAYRASRIEPIEVLREG